jgi:hypothetical protein
MGRSFRAGEDVRALCPDGAQGARPASTLAWGACDARSHGCGAKSQGLPFVIDFIALKKMQRNVNSKNASWAVAFCAAQRNNS